MLMMLFGFEGSTGFIDFLSVLLGLLKSRFDLGDKAFHLMDCCQAPH